MKTKMPLAEAEEIGNNIVQALAPFCERIEIAGSIRRKKPEVGDIEICCQPTPNDVTDMFGEVIRQDFVFYQVVAEKFVDRTFIKNGLRYKQICLGKINLDLFIVRPPAQWGVLFAIRTGPGDFSKWLVTPRKHNGALPSNARVKDGAVWQNGMVIPMPEENDFLKFVGLPNLSPKKRGCYAERLLK